MTWSSYSDHSRLHQPGRRLTVERWYRHTNAAHIHQRVPPRSQSHGGGRRSREEALRRPFEPPQPPHEVNLSITSSVYLCNRPSTARHPTIVIMTHLPVKLPAVEAAGRWRGSRSLSASNLTGLKSRLDIILTAAGATPPPNTSVSSRSLKKRPNNGRPDRSEPFEEHSGSQPDAKYGLAGAAISGFGWVFRAFCETRAEAFWSDLLL